MALGRSNSLSINTGQANSLFSSQSNASAQPAPASGGLFGGASTANNTQAKGTTSLFGNINPGTNATGTGLFGSNANINAAGGGLFGSGNTNTNTAGGGGLFGVSNANTNTTGGGLFGNAGNAAQAQQAKPLFGASTTAAQPQQSGGLFGTTAQTNTNTGGSGLFGGVGQQQQQQQQPQQGGSGLFGSTAARPAPTSLFGSAPAAQAQQSSLFGNTSINQTQGSGLFGGQTQATQQNAQPSIFGLSASQPQSLLNASQYRNSQYAPFAGKLTYGSSLAPAPAAQGAVKINFDTIRPTTRFGDCIEDIQKQIEAVDSMIQAQERFCREIEAFLPKHGSDVQSLSPDVELINEKADAAESALSMDAQDIAASRSTLEADARDFQRCRRVAENLRLPAQFHVPSSVGYGATRPPNANANGNADDAAAAYDMDLIGNYFSPRVAELQTMLNAYASNLTEIEAHLRVMEGSAVEKAQALAARRAGMGSGASAHASADDTVRELADTLRGFEGGILGAAGLVGECREGVNGLILGRVGGDGNGAGLVGGRRLR